MKQLTQTEEIIHRKDPAPSWKDRDTLVAEVFNEITRTEAILHAYISPDNQSMLSTVEQFLSKLDQEQEKMFKVSQHIYEQAKGRLENAAKVEITQLLVASQTRVEELITSHTNLQVLITDPVTERLNQLKSDTSIIAEHQQETNTKIEKYFSELQNTLLLMPHIRQNVMNHDEANIDEINRLEDPTTDKIGELIIAEGFEVRDRFKTWKEAQKSLGRAHDTSFEAFIRTTEYIQIITQTASQRLIVSQPLENEKESFLSLMLKQLNTIIAARRDLFKKADELKHLFESNLNRDSIILLESELDSNATENNLLNIFSVNLQWMPNDWNYPEKENENASLILSEKENRPVDLSFNQESQLIENEIKVIDFVKAEDDQNNINPQFIDNVSDGVPSDKSVFEEIQGQPADNHLETKIEVIPYSNQIANEADEENGQEILKVFFENEQGSRRKNPDEYALHALRNFLKKKQLILSSTSADKIVMQKNYAEKHAKLLLPEQFKDWYFTENVIRCLMTSNELSENYLPEFFKSFNKLVLEKKVGNPKHQKRYLDILLKCLNTPDKEILDNLMEKKYFKLVKTRRTILLTTINNFTSAADTIAMDQAALWFIPKVNPYEQFPEIAFEHFKWHLLNASELRKKELESKKINHKNKKKHTKDLPRWIKELNDFWADHKDHIVGYIVQSFQLREESLEETIVFTLQHIHTNKSFAIEFFQKLNEKITDKINQSIDPALKISYETAYKTALIKGEEFIDKKLIDVTSSIKEGNQGIHGNNQRFSAQLKETLNRPQNHTIKTFEKLQVLFQTLSQDLVPQSIENVNSPIAAPSISIFKEGTGLKNGSINARRPGSKKFGEHEVVNFDEGNAESNENESSPLLKQHPSSQVPKHQVHKKNKLG
ncbi:MAG: hypothetical protein H2069_07515 [Legionella sp.]|nr:hypothetical protein [Legionella sp.]